MSQTALFAQSGQTEAPRLQQLTVWRLKDGTLLTRARGSEIVNHLAITFMGCALPIGKSMGELSREFVSYRSPLITANRIDFVRPCLGKMIGVNVQL